MLWSIGGWATGLAGTALLLWALFWDRSRGRRRCRRCWYSLEGAADGDGGVTCPECGRTNRSRRAMLRTRRRWRWALGAVALVAMGYALVVTPRVRATGWTGAAPTWALVLCVPLLDDQVGSDGGPAAPIRTRPAGEQVAWAVKTRLYERANSSRFDRWLIERVARLEDARTLTDRTSVRGGVYTYVFEALAAQGRMRSEEAAWARGVHYLEVETPASLPQSAPVYARVVSFRRMLADRPTRVRIHERLYEARWDGAGGLALRPVGLRPGERWEDLIRVSDFVRWPNHMVASPDQQVRVRGIVYEGDPVADVWWPVAALDQAVMVRIADVPPERTVGVDAGVDAWLDALQAGLRWESDPVTGQERPVGYELLFKDAMLGESAPDGFTFGGVAGLYIQRSDHAGPTVEAEAAGAWWALRDQTDKDGSRVVAGRRQWVGFEAGGSDALKEYWGIGPDVRIESAWVWIDPVSDLIGENYTPLWDLDSSRVYLSGVKIMLTERDRLRLERFARVRPE